MRRFIPIFVLFMMIASGRVAAQTFEFFPIAGLSAHSAPAIVLGPDGAMWFINTSNGSIDRIDPAGRLTSFPLPGIPSLGLAAGPDGNLWLTLDDSVCRVTTAGVVTRFSVPSPNAVLAGIATGPDGNLWFVERVANKIGRISPAGVVAEYPIPGATKFPLGICAGPDGAMWFTEEAGAVGRITTQGAITEIALSLTTVPTSIVTGPDGNLWFTGLQANNVVRLTPQGQVTEYVSPTPLAYPAGITVGPDGALWFTEANANKIGTITVGGVISEIANPNVCPGQPLGVTTCVPTAIARGANNDLWFSDLKGITRIRLGPDSPCVADSTNVCLNGGRFKVSVAWEVPAAGTSGVATAAQLTSDTGYFWFFTPNNIELTVKVVDGRAFNDRFWVFGGAMSNVAYTITVRDTQAGQVKTYSNPSGTLASFADTTAF